MAQPESVAQRRTSRMTMKRQADDNWKKIQQRTFTNWFNDRLRGNLKVAKRQVADLEVDLYDGILLIELLQKLAAPKEVGRYSKRCVNNVQMIENLGTALRFIFTENIKLVNIGPEDIHGGNLKLILGLIWTLIRHYQIKSSGRGLSTKKAMMEWINTVIPEYGITNFNTNWNDGRAICATVDHIRPGACPNHLALDPNQGLENCRLGMDLAERMLDIPKIISPEDLNSADVDDLSVMTYLSYFCDPANQNLLQWIRKKIPDRNIKNLSTDWNDGINLGALLEACFPGMCPEWKEMDPTQAIANLEKLTALIKEKLGINCPVGASELANPKVDEIVFATYLSKFKNAKLQVSPEQFSLRVPSLAKGSAIIRKPVNFEIDTTGKKGDITKDLRVMAHGPSADIGVNLTQKENGLDASFIPTEAGSYDIMATYQGENISGSPFSLPVADPSNCLIFGTVPSELQVGKQEEVIVKTRGAGAGKLICTLDRSDESELPHLSGEVTEQENDQCAVILEPKAIGEAEVELKWAGENIAQTPFKVSICDASKCSVSGLDGSETCVGEPVKFKLKAKKTEVGESKPVIKPRGPTAKYEPEIKDSGDGSYKVSFTPWEVGPHKVDVMYGGEHVPKSPFSLNVTAAPDANTCSVTGKGLKKAVAGKPASFQIISPEEGLLKKKNSEGLSVKISSPEHIATQEIEDKGDGTYDVQYTAPEPGDYDIAMKFYDKHVPGSPFSLTVVPASDASKCHAYGPALQPTSLKIAGNPLDIYVDTKEAGTGDLKAVVKAPDNSRPRVFVANEKGVYSLKFDVQQPGNYYAHILWGGEHIPNSPFKIKVHPGPNAGMVKAYGPGLEPSFEIGQAGEFTIETKNAGIGTLTIRVHGVKGAFKIEANPVSETDPRTLKSHYDPREPGDYIIAIRWSGDHIPGSPFSINIRKPPKKKKKKDSDEDQESDGAEGDDEARTKKKEKKKGSPDKVAYYQAMQQQPAAVFTHPVFPTSPSKFAPYRSINEGGLMASRSHVVTTTSSKVEKKKSSSSEVRLQEEPSVIYYQKEKKKKKRKF